MIFLDNAIYRKNHYALITSPPMIMMHMKHSTELLRTPEILWFCFIIKRIHVNVFPINHHFRYFSYFLYLKIHPSYLDDVNEEFMWVSFLQCNYFYELIFCRYYTCNEKINTICISHWNFMTKWKKRLTMHNIKQVYIPSVQCYHK